MRQARIYRGARQERGGCALWRLASALDPDSCHRGEHRV